MQIHINSAYFFISIAKFNVNKEKYQALLADHQVDGRGPPVVRGPQVENRCLIYLRPGVAQFPSSPPSLHHALCLRSFQWTRTRSSKGKIFLYTAPPPAISCWNLGMYVWNEVHQESWFKSHVSSSRFFFFFWLFLTKSVGVNVNLGVERHQGEFPLTNRALHVSRLIQFVLYL